MTSITLSFFGPPEQKHVCKVTAMQTLADALQSVSSKFKPPLQPDQCQLYLNKKPVDMRTPFRLLNVPAGSKLEVIKKAASETPAEAPPAPASSTAAVVAPAAVAPTPAAPPATPAEATAPAAAILPAEATPAAAAARKEAGTQLAQVPQQQQVSFSIGQPAAAQTATPTEDAQEQASASTPPQPGTTAPPPAAAADSSSALNPALAALGVTVPVYVFHHRAIEAAAEQTPRPMDVDPPDEFFELTAEDLQRLQRQANDKRKAESVFRTRAAREAEEAARAANMGPVHVRLHFPDGTILQAAFKATDPLSQVQELLRKCANPDLAAALYLYTTPPKIVLKDSAATLYNLQLVPAAHIYVGLDEKKLQGRPDMSTSGPFLQTEVQSLMQDTVPDTHPATEQQQQGQADASGSSSSNSAEAMAAAQRALRLAAAASRQAGASGTAAGREAKVPKWFKK